MEDLFINDDFVLDFLSLSGLLVLAVLYVGSEAIYGAAA